MAAVMLFLRQTTGKTERHTHFCISLEPVFTRDCGGRVHFTDEPTGALDQASGREVLKLFGQLHEMGHTIVMITHDPNVAKAAGRTVRITDGMLLEEEK